MHNSTPDGIAVMLAAMFLAGFIVIAVWLLRR
jgi:MFS superfamily sulfate permease-like transporter